MSSTQRASESSAVVETVLSMIDAVAADDVLLVGERSNLLADHLAGRDLDVTSSPAAPSTDRRFGAVVVLGLGHLEAGSTLLRELHDSLSEHSALIVSAANVDNGQVTDALLTGSWPEHADATDRLFSASSLRDELERSGLIVEALEPVSDDPDSRDDPSAFVARGVPHRAAAQVASARRRVNELAAERNQLSDELTRLTGTVHELEATRSTLETSVGDLDRQVGERTARITDLEAKLATERAEGLRHRETLRAEIARLQNRRVLKAANRVGYLMRRFR